MDEITDTTADAGEKTVWDKTSEEMTVKDALKVQATILGVFAAIGGAVAATPVVVNQIDVWISNRRFRKQMQELEAEETTEETTEV